MALGDYSVALTPVITYGLTPTKGVIGIGATPCIVGCDEYYYSTRVYILLTYSDFERVHMVSTVFLRILAKPTMDGTGRSSEKVLVVRKGVELVVNPGIRTCDTSYKQNKESFRCCPMSAGLWPISHMVC